MSRQQQGPETTAQRCRCGSTNSYTTQPKAAAGLQQLACHSGLLPLRSPPTRLTSQQELCCYIPAAPPMLAHLPRHEQRLKPVLLIELHPAHRPRPSRCLCIRHPLHHCLRRLVNLIQQVGGCGAGVMQGWFQWLCTLRGHTHNCSLCQAWLAWEASS